jgi:hypothetical protein
MVNKFLTSMTIALHGQFGDTFEYYIEDVEQDLHRPSFHVAALNPMIRSISPIRYHRVIPAVLHYFTDKEKTSGGKKDCYAVAEQLLTALEYLKVDGLLFRGESISYEIEDNVLIFYITYSFDTTEAIERHFMETGTFNGVPM